MNLSGTLHAFRILFHPTLCLPHHKIQTFDQLPIPLSQAFARRDPNGSNQKTPDIRAVILDKDNCFAVPRENAIYPAYEKKFAQLREAYPGSRLLIVSNSAGTTSDPGGAEADILEHNTGVKVLRHSAKKPGCHEEIMTYFRNAPDSGVSHAGQVAVVGDRLFTDVIMANLMGSHAVWIEKGPVEDYGLLTRVEKGLEKFLTRRGYAPPNPKSEFE